MKDLFIEKSGKKLRCGFTTGSCAAAAAKAALIMLIKKCDINNVSIITPKGIVYNAEIVDITRNRDYVACAVIKDGGDDPDITTGSKIFAQVTFLNNSGILIAGGEGVGVVTKKGMDQPVGEAAINSVPRKMIRESLEEVLRKYGITDKGVSVVISVPGGEKLAEKTFNPKLGIVGGISILGTTGIVTPMSDEAIVGTIRTQAKIIRAEGKEMMMAAPGNYGISFLREVYGIDEDRVVQVSNFVYDVVAIAALEGFKRMLFVGHIGKLIKVSGGIRNTHSMYGDHRMEILVSYAKEILPPEIFGNIEEKIMSCAMTDEAVRILEETGMGDAIFKKMAEGITKNMEAWAQEIPNKEIKVETIVFSNENTELVSTDKAHDWIKEL